MTIGGSIFLIAVGAILAFAVNYSLAGVNVHIVGWILMAAGVLGILLSLLVWGPAHRRRTDVVEERVVREPRDPRY